MTVPSMTSSRRLAVRVTPDALRQIRGGHPWVFDASVTSVSHEGAVGDLAVVFDSRRKFAAIGLWDPDSPIILKILHHGSPCPIDDVFWRDRIASSLSKRASFASTANAGRRAYRVVHGENDGLPGLIVDRYSDVLVVKLYSSAWIPHLDDVVAAICAETGCFNVVLRAARLVQRGEGWRDAGYVDGTVIAGELDSDLVQFEEHGLLFEADVRHGQKTGHFLDQRANRQLVRDLTEGRDVLDMFCSTGGFTVHAAAGGATAVTSVDSSGPALQMTEHNLALNSAAVSGCEHTSIVGDAFEVMTKMAREGRNFDVVIVDPPSFAQRQADIAAGERAYQRLTSSALRLVRRGGLLVQSSCSSRIPPDRFFELVEDAAQSDDREIRLLRRTGHDIDHPIGFAQGEYLKTGFWRA